MPLAYFKYTIDGKTYADDLGETMSFKDFYAAVADGAMPVTSQVNVAEYAALFEQYLSQGIDLIHLTLSSGISGSYNSAKIAEEEMRTKYPDRKIAVIDSLAASSGYGLLLDETLNKRDAGYDFDKLVEWVENNKLRVHHWFFTSDLKHLKRSGRVSNITAIAGTFLNICPILNVDNMGRLTPRSKARGKANVVKDVVQRFSSLSDGGSNYSGKCFISHSACHVDAKILAQEISKVAPNILDGVMINSIGTVIGSHTGQGTVALFFWGSERTD